MNKTKILSVYHQEINITYTIVLVKEKRIKKETFTCAHKSIWKQYNIKLSGTKIISSFGEDSAETKDDIVLTISVKV